MFKRLVSLFSHLQQAYWDWKYGTPTKNDMVRYEGDDTPSWQPQITEIVVPDEKSKEEILKAFRYFHDQRIDTDYMAVNLLGHIHLAPNLIKVRTVEK